MTYIIKDNVDILQNYMHVKNVIINHDWHF